jgi:TP901 family phage tail tape measure protein
MANDRIVRIILQGDSGSVVRSFEVAGTAAEKAQTKFERMQKVGSGMSALGRTMTMVAAPVAALGAYAVKSAATFQQSMELIRTQAGQSQSTVNRMSAAVLNLAPSLGTSTSALADSLYHVFSGGIPAAHALQVMSIAAKAAKISGADLTDTTTALTASVFSGIKGAQNYSQAMGLLNATVGAGDMKMQDLNEAFAGPMLATVKGYGLSLKDVGASLATFGDLNIRGADAATELRMAVQYMAKPASTAGAMLQKLGLTTSSFSDAMARGGLMPALKLLHDRMQAAGIQGSQMASVISDLFTKKGAAGVTILENSFGKLQQKYKDVTKGATSFGGAWQATQKNVTFQWDKLKVTAQVALIHIGQALMPIVVRYLPPLVRLVKGAADWFTHLSQPVKDFIVGMTAFLVIGGPILMFFGHLITAVTTIKAGFEALKISEMAAGAAMKATIVGLVIVALVLLVTHFKQVKQVAGVVWTWMKTAVKDVAHVIGAVFKGLFDVLTWPFREAWKVISRFWHGVGSVVHTVGGVLHTATFGLLHTGGVVKPKYFAAGGPSGTDTIPGWLTPGEGVLTRAGMASVGGESGLYALNHGGGLGNITIVPETQVILKTSDREIGQAALRWTLRRAARGSSTLTGGSLMTGVTP